ncbi:lipoxygenase family protein [Gymnodinialimonas sp. 2305UL16-5]|uniref:lipoxygenase family protein n=1 Tax=Gymnodinialimonas mytili TaxID=3126503 RepID=UPI0030971987
MNVENTLAEAELTPGATSVDDATIREIVEKAKRETRIEYKDRGSFFTPRMRSINHLEVGRSKIITNPITIALEWAFEQWIAVKRRIKQVLADLFPRRDKIWCDRVDSHLVGRTIFGGDRGQGAPIHHLHLEFWGRTWLGSWRKLGQTRTDKDGQFRLPFDLRQARAFSMRKTYFEVHTTTRVYFKQDDPQFHFDLWKRIPIKPSDLIGMDYNLRTLRLDFWRYRENGYTPRAHVDTTTNAPEHYSEGRVDALISQVIPIELTKIKHLDQIEMDPGTLTIPQIQKDYPVNLTTCIEKYLPGYTRGDDWFGERMMNGMNRGYFQPDKTRKGRYWVRYFGKCWYEHNEIYALPDVDICFKLKKNGLPEPVEIHLTGKLSAYDTDPWQTRKYTPKDEPNWTYAKRVARVSGAFNTEVEEHFAGTHLNAEQFAVPCYRNLTLNPVAALLMPHLKEVSLINHTADKTLIGGYIQSASALSENGLKQRTRDIMGVQDWKGWRPMEPISPAHSCAKAEGMFWDVVCTYVDEFFALREAEIKEHWYEIYRFSEDLVNNAVPVAFTAPGDAPPEGDKWHDLAERRFDYYCGQYCFDPTLDRPVVDGQTRAISRITSAQSFDQAGPEDWQNLKDACKYAIMVATYLHTWINEHQYDDLGEVLYSCGGLRYGEKPRGIMAPEDDYDIAPDLVRSTQMLWFTNLLSRTEYGFITVNEENDVNPHFARLLEERREAFAALGVDVDSIESRTNI